MEMADYTVIEPHRAFSFKFLKEIIEYRELLYMLVKREISIRYRNTFIGVGWILLQPLLSTIIFVAVFYRFVKMPIHGNSPFSFYLAGLIPWFFFSTSINRAYTSLTGYEYMISKIYFPRVILPLTSCITSLYDSLFQIISFLLIAIFVGTAISWKIVFILPVFLWLFLISLGVSLWISILCALYRDIQYVIPFFLQVLFFLTPIFYTYDNIPERFRFYASFNPLIPVVEYCRWIFLPQYNINNLTVYIPATIALLIIIGGMIYFQKKDATIPDLL